MSKPPPTVDLSFILSMIDGNDKVEDIIKVGNSRAYVIKGTKPIALRMIIISHADGQVPYEWAVGTSIKLKCQDKLSEWYEQNRNWKDGGYFQPK